MNDHVDGSQAMPPRGGIACVRVSVDGDQDASHVSTFNFIHRIALRA